MRLRPLLIITITAAALLSLPACIVSAGNQTDVHDRPSKQERDGLPVGRYTGAIHAARSIAYPSDRAAVLKTIAAKPDIDEADQRRLVRGLVDLGYGSDRVDVALTLIQNPAATPATKALIGDNIARIASYSSDRERIAAALAQ